MTTDAQDALVQVREALAAGPTPGPWYVRTNRHPTLKFSRDAKRHRLQRRAVRRAQHVRTSAELGAGG